MYEGETAIIYKDFVYFFGWKLTRKTSTLVTIIILCSNVIVMHFFLTLFKTHVYNNCSSYVYNNQKNVFLDEVLTIAIDLTYITTKCNEIQHSKFFIHKFPQCKLGEGEKDTPLSPKNKF